jgi:hypothetical protein
MHPTGLWGEVGLEQVDRPVQVGGLEGRSGWIDPVMAGLG